MKIFENLKKLGMRIPRIAIFIFVLILGAGLIYFLLADKQMPSDEIAVTETPGPVSVEEPGPTIRPSPSVSSPAPTVRPSPSVSSPVPTAQPSPSATALETPGKTAAELAADRNFKVIAYYPCWKENGLSKLRFDIVTHVNYAFAFPSETGNLLPLNNPALAAKVIRLAHEHGRKVLLSVGGWSDFDSVPLEKTFKLATSTPEKLTTLAEDILAMCDEYGFDGVDMDWEYPRVDDGSYLQYETLMAYLSERLHARGKLLTAAVISGVAHNGTPYYDNAAQTETVLSLVDWVNVMAYDGGDGALHSGYEFAVNCGDYWKNTRSLGKAKVVLGMPFYGRPNWISYEDLLAVSPGAYDSDISTYYGTEVWYNGHDTIADKTRYAAENLGGIMIWEITQDSVDPAKSLLTAVQEVLIE